MLMYKSNAPRLGKNYVPISSDEISENNECNIRTRDLKELSGISKIMPGKPEDKTIIWLTTISNPTVEAPGRPMIVVCEDSEGAAISLALYNQVSILL